MNMKSNKVWKFRARGDYAFFGGMHTGPDRVSMLAPSASAVEGLLRSVLGKREMFWEAVRVSFLSVPTMMPILANEMKWFLGSSKGERPSPDKIHTQRLRTYLSDVDLVVEARVCLHPRNWRPGVDSTQKFDHMVERRARQHRQRFPPYFGMKECTAQLTPVSSDGYVEEYAYKEGVLQTTLKPLPPPVDLNHNLGLAFYGRDYRTQRHYLAPLQIVRGVVDYPTWEEVRSANLSYGPLEAAQ